MRTRTEYEQVQKLASKGFNKSQIARETKIPRATIRDWLTQGFCPKSNGKGAGVTLDAAKYVNESDERRSAYAFVLGEYLGDGYVRSFRNSTMFRLGIYNDVKYEALNQLIESRLHILFPDNRISRLSASGGSCWEISVYNASVPQLFPQMGVGRKHDRKIELLPWQIDIVKSHPKEFVKGLIYSDGCIYEQSQWQEARKYTYLYYSFCNRSVDIANYLSWALSMLGVNVTPRFNQKTQSYIVNIRRKAYCQVLESFVSRKTDIVV